MSRARGHGALCSDEFFGMLGGGSVEPVVQVGQHTLLLPQLLGVDLQRVGWVWVWIWVGEGGCMHA